LLRWPTFAASLPSRRDLLVDFFHGKLIQTLFLRGFPRLLEPFWSGRWRRDTYGDLVVQAIERPSRLSRAVFWSGDRSLAL